MNDERAFVQRAFVRAQERLQAVLADPEMGLGAGPYYFRFSNRKFLRALVGAEGLEPSSYGLEGRCVNWCFNSASGSPLSRAGLSGANRSNTAR